VSAFKVALGHPSDVSGVLALLEQGAFAADDVVAVTGKTEGTAERDDRTRQEADRALRAVLSERGSRSEAEIGAIPMVFSSGAVGLLEPNAVIYVRRPCAPADPSESSLVIGTAQTPAIREPDIGRLPMLLAVSRAVEAAADGAGLAANDARYVLTKSRMPELDHGADGVGPEDMAWVRRTSGAAALGVGVAVGELALPDDRDIGSNPALWTSRASTSTGHENAETQVILFGNKPGVGGTLRVGRAVMADVLDVQALNRAIQDAGVDVPASHIPEAVRARVVALYVKIGTPEGTLRGHRQVRDDVNPHYDVQVKATVGGIFAAAVGDPAIYISGGAVHQAPVGGGSVAVIVDKA